MSDYDEFGAIRPTGGPRTAREGTPLAVDVSRDVRNRRPIAMFVAGPVIWSVHFMVVYLVAEAGCTGEGPGLELLDAPVPTVVTLVATAVAAVACIAAAALSYRRWRTNRRQLAEGGGLEAPDLGGNLAFAGFLMSLLGVMTVLFVGLPAMALPAC
jgi:hypothetical protein